MAVPRLQALSVAVAKYVKLPTPLGVPPDRDPVQAHARQLVASVAAQVGAGAAPRV